MYNRFVKEEEKENERTILEREVIEELRNNNDIPRVNSENSEAKETLKSEGNKEKIGFRDRKVNL